MYTDGVLKLKFLLTGFTFEKVFNINCESGHIYSLCIMTVTINYFTILNYSTTITWMFSYFLL